MRLAKQLKSILELQLLSTCVEYINDSASKIRLWQNSEHDVCALALDSNLYYTETQRYLTRAFSSAQLQQWWL